MILQHKTKKSIQHLVDLIWYVHERDLPLQRQEDIIVPSGHIHIVYNFMEPYFLKGKSDSLKSPTPLKVPDIVLVGQFKSALHIQYGKCVKQLGLAMTPTGFKKVFGEISGLYTESMIDCREFSNMKKVHTLVLNSINRQDEVDDTIELIEDYFENLSIDNKNLRIFDEMIAYIESRKGLIDVTEMAELFGYSMSALERNFKKNLGLTPKAYANIIRFRYAVLEDDPTCLFYDQSHYIKNCKKYTGKIPADLTQSEEISLLNMLHLK